MKKEMEMKQEIFNQLDYWCEQYKIANDINHDLKESARISENIKALERVLRVLWKEAYINQTKEEN